MSNGVNNDVIFAKNADFTSVNNTSVTEANGLVTDGKMWIGSTSVNIGGTHINVGTLTSPDSSVTIGYSSPNITLEVDVACSTVPNLVFIDSQTASSSAQLDFLNLSSTYKGYRFYLSSLLPAGSTRLQMVMSIDNGSSFIGTATYRSTVRTLTTAAVWATISAGLNGTWLFQSANSTQALSGYIDVYFNNGANSLLTVKADLGHDADGMTIEMSGNNIAPANVDAIRFREGTGNISSGTIYRFGIL